MLHITDNDCSTKEKRFDSAGFAACDKWIVAQIEASIDDSRPNVPHDEVMADLDIDIATIDDKKRRARPGEA